jgi:hypothetical protein
MYAENYLSVIYNLYDNHVYRVFVMLYGTHHAIRIMLDVSCHTYHAIRIMPYASCHTRYQAFLTIGEFKIRTHLIFGPYVIG